MDKMKNKTIRCAIYTRVSDNDGLEHLVTSVEAQYAACVEYIKIHKENGWILLPGNYADEGYRGAITNRPAFNRLRQDIIARKIDMVVVYRYDRIARDIRNHIIIPTAKPPALLEDSKLFYI